MRRLSGIVVLVQFAVQIVGHIAQARFSRLGDAIGAFSVDFTAFDVPLLLERRQQGIQRTGREPAPTELGKVLHEVVTVPLLRFQQLENDVFEHSTLEAAAAPRPHSEPRSMHHAAIYRDMYLILLRLRSGMKKPPRRRIFAAVRLDKFMKVSRLSKRRSEAHEALEHGRITKDGRTLKPGYAVKPGDVLEIHYATKFLTVRVLEVPLRGGPGVKPAGLYEIVGERKDEPAQWA